MRNDRHFEDLLESFVRRAEPTNERERCEENDVQKAKTKSFSSCAKEHNGEPTNDVQYQNETVDWKIDKTFENIKSDTKYRNSITTFLVVFDSLRFINSD